MFLHIFFAFRAHRYPGQRCKNYKMSGTTYYVCKTIFFHVPLFYTCVLCVHRYPGRAARITKWVGTQIFYIHVNPSFFILCVHRYPGQSYKNYKMSGRTMPSPLWARPSLFLACPLFSLSSRYESCLLCMSHVSYVCFKFVLGMSVIQFVIKVFLFFWASGWCVAPFWGWSTHLTLWECLSSLSSLKVFWF